eukprot:7480858-Alexandrium_andersonii.AAC.1
MPIPSPDADRGYRDRPHLAGLRDVAFLLRDVGLAPYPKLLRPSMGLIDGEDVEQAPQSGPGEGRHLFRSPP